MFQGYKPVDGPEAHP